MGIMDEDYELDVNEDQNIIEQKFPINSGSQRKMIEMQDFHQIPLDRLIPYQKKDSGDFSKWKDSDFDELVDSVRTHGVLEPITVRPYIYNGENFFEILAGEHRWKASKALNLPTIPARVRHECDDEEAVAIFTLTNIMKRESSLKDKAFGCWLYATKTKYKTEEKIQDLAKEGVLSVEELTTPLSRSQLYRYSKIHELPQELFNLVDSGVLDLKTGARMAQLDNEQREDLSEYYMYIKSKALGNKLVDLATGMIESKVWSIESIEEILLKKAGVDAVKKNSLSYASLQAKQVIKDIMPVELYEKTDDIFREALKLYFEKHNITEKVPPQKG